MPIIEPVISACCSTKPQKLLEEIRAGVAQYSKMPPEPQLQDQDSRWSFSRSLAQKIGIMEAIILKYLGARVRKSTHRIGDKQWVYLTITDIAKKYPFVGRSTVSRALKELRAKELILVERHNRYAYDRTQWYHVSSKNQDDAERDLVYFEPSEADQYGLNAAIVLNHLRYFSLGYPQATKEGWIKVVPSELCRHQPFFSKKVLRSALYRLVELKAIEKKAQAGSQNQAGEYKITPL